ncbi:hypothetical protein EDD86DRAFT_246523 [Gorgonomyces haynaldii]|nr:hypothetical protein EDD86DRAFT_246523 [Gorgonomyces haynaldii]
MTGLLLIVFVRYLFQLTPLGYLTLFLYLLAIYTDTLPQKRKRLEMKYDDQLEPLQQKLLDYADLEKNPSQGPNKAFETLIDQKNEQYTCLKVGADFFFRIIVDFESTMEETFDLMADITQRPNWDEVTESAGFMRTRGIWPTAPRIALVLAFINRTKDGRLVNVTKSIDDHPDFVQPDGDVRMLANIAGLVIEKHPSGDPKRCRCIQIVDGDLGGWLPKSVVSMVTTQAFPISMRRVNKTLRKTENPRSVSQLIEKAVGKIEIPLQSVQTVQPKPQKQLIPVKKQQTWFQLLFKLAEKAQPFLVLYLFIAHFLKKK